MVWLKLFIISVIVSILFVPVQSHKDWIKWFKSIKLVKVEFLSGRTLGLHKNSMKSFEVLMDGINYNISPSILINPVKNGPKEADIINGRGLILKGNPLNPIQFSVDLPKNPKQANICGLVLTSFAGSGNDFIHNLRIFWKSMKTMGWDILSNPLTGEHEYVLRMRPKENTRVIIFDSVPAQHFLLMLTTMPGKNVNFKLGFLQNCRYQGTIEIKNCGEKIEQNPRFANLPFAVPISIKCPVDCIRTWPCWGFKIYSSDSPICWTATQTFGRWGDGAYTLYKIPTVLSFESEVDPQLTHGIYCKSSILQYPGYTFDRKFYDMAKKEYRDTMGA